MYELISMALALAAFIILIRWKIKIGLAMVPASFVLEAMLRVSPAAVYRAAVVKWQTEPLSQTTGYLLVTLAALVNFVNVTGLAMPTVAITFPLLQPFMTPNSQLHIGYQTLAFSGLMCGMYLTPVHLRLTMSAGYFQTSLGKIIAMLIAPTLFVAAAGIAAAMLF